MFDRDKWIEVFQVLGKNPFRTAATAFGVMWGIMMLIIMMGSGKGLENGVNSNFNRVTNSMSVWSQSTTMAYKGFKRGRSIELNSADVAYLKSTVPDIDLISPRAQLGGYRGGNNVTHGIRTGAFTVIGDTPDYIKIEPRDFNRGRFINWDDLDESRKVCVIGERVYAELFNKTEEPLGSYIQINGVNFMVVGTFQSRQSGEQAEEDTKTIFMPLTTFQKAFNWGDQIGWMTLTAKADVDVAVMADEVINALKERHTVNPKDDRAFGHWNMQKMYRRMTGIFGGIRALSWIVGILTLFAGIIGVSNIMLVIIKERTNELGVRKALGATPWNIVSQILLEALFLSAIAGFLGIICGVWLLEGVNMAIGKGSTSFVNPGVSFKVLFSALIVLVFGGMLAGLLPAIRAVRIKPIEALRTE